MMLDLSPLQDIHGEPSCISRPACIRLSNHVGGTYMSTILIIVLVLLLIGALPTWPYSTGWGYYPSGGVGLVVLVLVVLLLMGRL